MTTASGAAPKTTAQAGFATFVLALALAACGDSDPDLGGACAKQRAQQVDGSEMVICEELHAEAPHVRLPDPGSDRVFGEIVWGSFRDANGKQYGVEERGDLERATPDRHGSAVYLADVDGNKVSNLRPALVIEERHFLSNLLGQAFEGTVSARATGGEAAYEEEATLPVRVEFATGTSLRQSDGQAVLKGGIVNLADGVTAADGSCLPALTSYGDESPASDGMQVELEGFRVPGMHLFADDVFVIEWYLDGQTEGNVMGIEWYASPFDVVRGLTPPTTLYRGLGHGTPGYTPTIELLPVSGGGEPCND